MAKFSEAGLTPSASDFAEYMRMWQEKYAAFGESALAIASKNIQLNQIVINEAMRRSLHLWTNPGSALKVTASSKATKLAANTAKKALTPIHRRATANAKRLNRRKRP